MTEMNAAQQFLVRFAEPLSGAERRRIVIWHDAAGEFEEDFDGLAVAAASGEVQTGERPVRFEKAQDGSLFSLKRLIAREDTESDFAVYRQRAAGDIAGDLLADIELYAEHFRADGLSLLLQSLDAADTAEVRRALEDMRAFFVAKDRVARFAAVAPHPQNAGDVYSGVLAAALDAKEPTAQAIVRAYALRSLIDQEEGQPGVTLEQLRKFGADEALARFVGNVTGFEGELSQIDVLMEHLLLSALSATVPEGVMDGLQGRYSPAHGQFCLVNVHDWNEAGARDSAMLADVAESVQDRLNLELRFAKVPSTSLLNSDVFPAAARAIVADLAASMAQGADRRDEVRDAAGARSGLAGYADVACYFDALMAAADMQDFLRAHAEGYHEAPAARVWDAYVGGWWQMDAAYRRFCEAAQRCVLQADPTLSDSLGSLMEWANNQYVNGFVTPANECWTATAEHDWETLGYVEGVPRQRRFYDEVVENELAGAKRVVVIVSDALRYEVGHQLAEALEQRQRVKCELSAVQATFPSITSLGMAALLPHRSMAVSAEGGLSVTVDGMSTAGTKQREAVLQARRSASTAVSAKDLLAMKGAEQKALARDAEVVYIYHNAIDAAGEASATEHNVFAACDQAIDDICALVRIAANQMGASRMVVTADHGFLYTREPVPASDKLGLKELEATDAVVGERYVVAPGGSTDGLLLSVSMDAAGGEGLIGLAPRGFVRINRPGGVSHYAHGGLSLEELCVPVLRVHGGSRAKGIAAAAPAEVRLLDTDRRITSMLFGVRLYQPEPVGGKVTPATYEVVMTDDGGNPVSDVRRAVADRTDADERARSMELRFALKEGRAYRSSDAYYLVARDTETGMPLFSEPYTIDIAFAPMDDFGF